MQNVSAVIKFCIEYLSSLFSVDFLSQAGLTAMDLVQGQGKTVNIQMNNQFLYQVGKPRRELRNCPAQAHGLAP